MEMNRLFENMMKVYHGMYTVSRNMQAHQIVFQLCMYFVYRKFIYTCTHTYTHVCTDTHTS